jgi:hypothetical protein
LLTGKLESECNAYPWKSLKPRFEELKAELRKLDSTAFARNEGLFSFLNDVINAQLQEDPTGASRPTKKSVALIIGRENRVLKARRKYHKRLLVYREVPGQDGYRSREALKKAKGQGPQDTEIFEITFRLGSAIRFFNDLRAEVA